MLPLDSPLWSHLSHAYGNASDVPALIAQLRSSSPAERKEVQAELSNTIMHKGDVHTATYAAPPHLLDYDEELGPCRQSDGLLFSIALASPTPGPAVPVFV